MLGNRDAWNTCSRIGRNSPRTSAGASGFMSQVSCCAGPPHMKSRMQAFALPKEAAESGGAEFATDCPEIVRASRNLGRERPSKPKLPARMTSRRDRDNARPRFWQPVSSMGLVRGIRGCLNGGCVRSARSWIGLLPDAK